MNPRQRRGLLLVALAALGALAVFLSVSSYVSDVRSEVGPLVNVLRAKEDVKAYSGLGGDNLEAVRLPERWVPEAALHSGSSLSGWVAAADIPSGSLLQRGMVVPQPAVGPGKRELTILIDAESGLARKIGPGEIVDIEATFDLRGQGRAPKSQVLVSNVRVLDIGSPSVRLGERRVPVTFVLSRRESLVATYAESFATTVRLAVVGPLEAKKAGSKKAGSRKRGKAKGRDREFRLKQRRGRARRGGRR